MGNKNRKKNNAGFTLIELLVVIAIIGLLASVILVSASAARTRGRDGKRMADLNQLAKALELFFDDYKGYPTATNASGTYVAGGVLLASGTSTIQGLTPGYLTQMPTSPNPADGSCGSAVGINNNNYWYESDLSSNKATRYTVTFCLGVGQRAGLSAGVHTMSTGYFR